MRHEMEERKRRRLVIILVFLALVGWTGSRLLTTGQLESVWDPSIPPAHYQPGIQAGCVPNYTEPALMGGRTTPISEQTPQLRRELCLVGCWEDHGVKSYRITFGEDRQPYCSCDLNDCSPQELPGWHLVS